MQCPNFLYEKVNSILFCLLFPTRFVQKFTVKPSYLAVYGKLHLVLSPFSSPDCAEVYRKTALTGYLR